MGSKDWGETKAAAWIAEILRTGSDPKAYRQGIADSAGISVERVDQMIASTPHSRRVESAEETAQRRLAEDRQYRQARKAFDHEEE